MKSATTPQTAATKWQTRAGAAGADYVAGAQAASQLQANNAIAQAQSWLDGVNNAGVKSFTSGLQAALTVNRYSSRIGAVGQSRYTNGVSTALQTFQAQIAKVLAVESAVQLSAKGPKGSPANIQRATEMMQALRAAKVSGAFQGK
jgi:hypothetical protein